MNCYPHEILSKVRHVNFALDLPDVPLVLLHGFTENHKVWDSVIPDLKELFWILRPDLPGHGSSEFPEDIKSMESIADWLVDFLDSLEIKKCFLAGHSLGGYIALAAARKYPDYFEGICLVNSTPIEDTAEKKENRLKSIEFIRKNGGESFIRTLIPSLFANSTKQNNPEWLTECINRSLKTNDTTLIRFLEIMMNRTSGLDVIAKAQVPVSLILGAQDTLISCEYTAGIMYHYPDSHVEVLHNSAHMSMVEEPNVVAKALSLFLLHKK